MPEAETNIYFLLSHSDPVLLFFFVVSLLGFNIKIVLVSHIYYLLKTVYMIKIISSLTAWDIFLMKPQGPRLNFWEVFEHDFTFLKDININYKYIVYLLPLSALISNIYWFLSVCNILFVFGLQHLLWCHIFLFWWYLHVLSSLLPLTLVNIIKGLAVLGAFLENYWLYWSFLLNVCLICIVSFQFFKITISFWVTQF